jgi:short subunit dehydrogenase-like uncharacterized protein
MSLLVYGATGYIGHLCPAEAKARNVPTVLAGRDIAKVRAVAAPLGFDYAAADLSDHKRLVDLANRARAVLHIAGPYSTTAAPMLDACLAAGVHYIDVTGAELQVMERHIAHDEVARERNIMLLPSAGFGVVPRSARQTAKARPASRRRAARWRRLHPVLCRRAPHRSRRGLIRPQRATLVAVASAIATSTATKASIVQTMLIVAASFA